MQPVGRDCSPRKEGERMRERKKEAAVGPQGQRGRGRADKRNTLFLWGCCVGGEGGQSEGSAEGR